MPNIHIKGNNNVIGNHNKVTNSKPVILTHSPRATKKDINFVSDLIRECIKKPSK